MGAQYSNNLDVIKVITYLTSTRACNKAHWIVKIWGNTFVTTSQQCGFCVVRIAVKRQSVTLTLAATLTRNIFDKHSKPKHTINSVKWLTLTIKKSRENLPPFLTTNKIICSSCVQTIEVTVDAVAWQRIISRDNGSAGPRTEPKSTKAVGHYRVYYKPLIYSIFNKYDY